MKNKEVSLSKFFNPKSIAVVGASNRPGSVGCALMKNIAKSDYPGTVFMGSSNFTFQGLLNQGELNERYSDKEHYVMYLNKFDALGREKFLKSGSGRIFIKRQLKNYLKTTDLA